MLIDDLVTTIETLQQRIVQYKDELGSSEALTRYVLINPLLRALGWNLEDPAQVRPEYGGVGGGLADYALFGDGAAGKPAVILEAKSLDTVLSSTVVNQAFQYCFQLGIGHMVITDGNRWRCFDLLTPGLAIREREIKSITLTAEPAYKLALQLLLLWRPNLASGEPVAASEPVLSTEQATPDSQSTNTQQPATDAPPSPSDEGWTSLAELQNVTGRPPPSVIRLPDGAEKTSPAGGRCLSESPNGTLVPASLFQMRALFGAGDPNTLSIQTLSTPMEVRLTNLAGWRTDSLSILRTMQRDY